jgi:hypothetical protein
MTQNDAHMNLSAGTSPVQDDGHPIIPANARSARFHTAETPGSTPREGYQNLAFTDPVAFRYLEEDPSTVVLDRRRTLTGYEIYIVEQWACSRVHPTFVINTYTGDHSRSAVVSVLSVPRDETTWSPRLKVYFNAMSQFHARKRDTPLGILMVTNLSSFPSALTVVAVPDGDVQRHKEDFIVNEDLKRLGCSGRAGLNLEKPTAATQAKFHQLYRISERVPIYDAVMELVKQCQMALTIFDKLAPEYVDGLLCDITEGSINDWWTEIGTDFFNIEPSDGILGPTTVAALLGMMMGARNRLHAFGAPVGKDVFDFASLKRGIGSFQKSQKLERTRRLDRQTLDRLHRVTAKAASGDGWTVPRAVKSTVAELGGKGGEIGEMVMGIVGARDKAGISEVETLDMDQFVQLVSGERSKWLWMGKPWKTGSNVFGHVTGDEELVFTEDERGGYVWAGRKRDTTVDYPPGRPSLETEQSGKQMEAPSSLEEKDQQSKLALKRSVTGRVSDARAGFGRFRGVVGLPGLRSHHHKHSKQGVDLVSDLAYLPAVNSQASPAAAKTPTEATYTFDKEPIQVGEARNDAYQERQELSSGYPGLGADHPTPLTRPEQQSPGVKDQTQEPRQEQSHERAANVSTIEDPILTTIKTDRAEASCIPEQAKGPVIRFLRRPQSCLSFPTNTTVEHRDAAWPRHLSFSTVEDTVLVWEDVCHWDSTAGTPDATPAVAILREDIMAFEAGIVSDKVLDLSETTASWVEHQVEAVECIDRRAQSHLGELNSVYQEKLEDYHSLRERSRAIISRESSSLIDQAKKVELLGAKLDYELNVLQSRIEDVEDGLTEYERHIIEIEGRVRDLDKDDNKTSRSWLSWGDRVFNRSKDHDKVI